MPLTPNPCARLPAVGSAAVLLVALAVVFPVSARAQARTARIQGLVLDSRSGKPVAAAMVLVEEANVSAETSDRGRFALPGIGGGAYSLVVQRIGYETRRSDIRLAAGQDVDVTIRLTTKPVELEPIEVVTRSGKLAEAGFYERRDFGGLSGRYITHVDLERRNATQLTDALVDVQGVKVLYLEPGRTTVRFNRHVPEEPGPGQKGRLAMSGGNALSARGCEPDLYIDGRLYRNSSPPLQTTGSLGFAEALNKVDDFNALPVSEIEGVEVYVGAAVPPFVRNTACGVILLWTRR